MGRGRSSSLPPAAPALLLLFLVCFSHGVAAARLLPPLQPAAVVVPPQQVLQQAENGATAAAAVAVADGLVLPGGEAAANGDELSISEMMGAEEATAICQEEDDECLERRLLGDAHLDYIYTQHKGKP